ncbi:hypothetical protein [Vibrio agarivorans]|uniref:DUF3630 domain-containing protein n=1 Tax=Vibrio agarivorans TaxID=153622 RepID=A0ABT7Y7I4_9VIBR|nr:hypothetical protein [Vibrio agarivorans]MDN2484012.1 hypothetical protein [Vibrio agarivorans]
MEIVLADSSSPRIEIWDFTAEIVVQLSELSVEVPLIEIDDDQDNLFVTVRDREYLSGIYLGIEVDNGRVNIWLNERGHSGGDPTLDSFDFCLSEAADQLSNVCQMYINSPKF